MGFACIVMYAMAATHWGLTIQELFANDKGSNTVQDMTSECIDNILSGEPCSDDMASIFEVLGPEGSGCIQTALLIVNVSPGILHAKLASSMSM
jgi:hypothetical protein